MRAGTGHLHIDVKAQNIDMLSLTAHKFHGPKGCGVLYARRGVRLYNLIEGGAQERACARAQKTFPPLWAWPPRWKRPAAISISMRKNHPPARPADRRSGRDPLFRA
jgi:hypothetical protein